MTTKEQKQAKKAEKKIRRKSTRPWKGLSLFTGIVTVVLLIASFVLSIFDNTFAIIFGSTFWKLKNADANAVYFESSDPEFKSGAKDQAEVAELVEAGGATLLMNKTVGNQPALPLAKGERVNLFSTSSVNPVFGGTGSGNVDASKALNFKQVFEAESVGLDVNETLWDFYETGAGKKYARTSAGIIAPAGEVSEAPWDVYTDEVLNSVSGTAIVVISRIGGEGADATYTLDQTQNYLELDEHEKQMLQEIKRMKETGKITKTVVLLNYSNTVELDFLFEEKYGVDACLWIGGIGQEGSKAVADILVGNVNPSGSLADTFLKDNFSSPAMVNSVALQYADAESRGVPSNAQYYMVYQEGIYVGYRYYETRYYDAVTGKGNTAGYDYDADVAFPFGYGLSYSEFEYRDFEAKYNLATDSVDISLTVANVSDVPGRETVQIYVQQPYVHGTTTVEKSAVVLAGFDKTGMLAANDGVEGGADEQVVNISIARKDITSYDETANGGSGGYVLEAGNYYFTAATDAHNAVNNILASKDEIATDDGVAALVGVDVVATTESTKYNVGANGEQITNEFENADINKYENADNGPIKNGVTYLSRSDWKGTFPDAATTVKLTAGLILDLQDIQYLEDGRDYMGDTAVIKETKDNGLTLLDFKGYDLDETITKNGKVYSWDDLIDQMSFEDMRTLIGDSFHWTHAVESINAPGTRDENGPQGLTMTLFGGTSPIDTMAFSSEDVMAATFDKDLMYDVGLVIGKNCLDAGVSFLYGTGNNIHRTPYGGRNFEYYSEDGYLSGKICAEEVKGMKVYGAEVLMKHFALNESEQQRLGLGVWLNEQSAREIYLKAFQIPIVEANANGVMTAYTRWGAIWSGGNPQLMHTVLRKEWGCKGMQITDNCLVNYVNTVDGVIAGVTVFDNMLPYIYNDFADYENDPVVVEAMRRATKYNLYAIVNSNAMNGIGPNTVVKAVTPYFVVMSIVFTVLFGLAFVACLTMYIIKRIKYSKDKKQKNA